MKRAIKARPFPYKQANNVLLALIVLVNLYVIAAPFLPKLYTWWQLNHSGARATLSQQITRSQGGTPDKPVANHIIAPDMLLDQPIYDGPVRDTYKILHKGIWRYPLGSVPGQAGNTVLIGHRFTYTNPRGVFYSMDKLKVGSQIAIWWNNRQYDYTVSEVKVVPPSDISVEQQTSDTRLTMYTCTPLWHPTSRLVVIAKPEVKT